MELYTLLLEEESHLWQSLCTTDCNQFLPIDKELAGFNCGVDIGRQNED